MSIKYAKKGGWFYEKERHRLSALGIKTGHSSTKKYPPYPNPIQHGIMQLQLPTKLSAPFYNRHIHERNIHKLKDLGWTIRPSTSGPQMMTGGFEAWKGQNYLSITLTDWHQYTVDEAFIIDKDVADRLTPLFRKRYPQESETSKESTKEKIWDLLTFKKSQAKRQTLNPKG